VGKHGNNVWGNPVHIERNRGQLMVKLRDGTNSNRSNVPRAQELRTDRDPERSDKITIGRPKTNNPIPVQILEAILGHPPVSG
jgi:hypothetical protein